jgi:hypothetical protein
MSKNINDSTKLKLAKRILEMLRETEKEREKQMNPGEGVPELGLSIGKLIEDNGFKVKAPELARSEVIRGMFFKKGDRLIPELGIRSLAQFNNELEEQIRMYEGAFGREVLRPTQPRRIESGFVHNAARRK